MIDSPLEFRARDGYSPAVANFESEAEIRVACAHSL
jgi:hypothetical protein